MQSTAFSWALVGIAILPMSAMADVTEAPTGGLTVSALGAQAATQGVAFFTTLEAPAGAAPRNCLYGNYYVDLSTPGGRAIYATLLTTKSLGKKLARLDWSNSAGQCFATLVTALD